MKVFISWSQDTSKSIAPILKENFEYFFNKQIEFWVSSLDITTGSFFTVDILETLSETDVGIICLDKSNFKQNWLYFESGFIYGHNYDISSKRKQIIFPIIFDNSKVDIFSGTPFQHLQLKYFNKDNIKNMLKKINECYYIKNNRYPVDLEIFERHFESIWNKLYSDVNNIIQQNIVGGDGVLTEDNIVTKISKYNFPAPIYGDVIEFSKGFETHNFYLFLLQNTSKRLYIFGRKNRKLTDRSFEQELSTILSKNIDFRLLYLSPNSTLAQSGIAQDLEDFREKLIFSIKEFSNTLKTLSYSPEDYCRMYDEKRESELIIADNVVFYKDMEYASDGKPLHFTNSKFYVTSINSILGSKYFDIFKEIWEKNEKNKITSSFVQGLK